MARAAIMLGQKGKVYKPIAAAIKIHCDIRHGKIILYMTLSRFYTFSSIWCILTTSEEHTFVAL